MATYRYTPGGRLTSYTKSSRDLREENAWVLPVLLVCLVLAPFAPLLGASYLLWQYLTHMLHWHALFAGFLAVLPTVFGLWLLVRSKMFRRIYFGFVTLVGSVLVFSYVAAASDTVWGTFSALIALVVGLVLTRFVSNFDLQAPSEVATSEE